MSWKSAQREARRWLDSLNLPADLRGSGRQVDLREAAAKIEGTEGYRIMVIRAAERILAERQISARLPETK